MIFEKKKFYIGGSDWLTLVSNTILLLRGGELAAIISVLDPYCLLYILIRIQPKFLIRIRAVS